jgi:hypothetical protein
VPFLRGVLAAAALLLSVLLLIVTKPLGVIAIKWAVHLQWVARSEVLYRLVVALLGLYLL